MTIRCLKCQVEKPDKEFHRSPSSHLGRIKTCRSCINARNKVSRSNPEYRLKHAAMNRAWAHKNAQRVKDAYTKVYLNYQYGLSPEEIERQKMKQGNACALCRRTDRKLVVDHSHKTGTFRGLLCRACNVGIAQLGDDIAGLKRAIAYLRGKANQVQLGMDLWRYRGTMIGDRSKQCELASGNLRSVAWLPLVDARENKRVRFEDRDWRVLKVYRTIRIEGKEFDDYLCA